MPDAQPALSKHGWPSAASVGGADDVGAVVGGSVAVGASAGLLLGGGGGGVAVPAQPTPTTRLAAISNSLTCMGASYTLRDG
jgi:hypothetical protein